MVRARPSSCFITRVHTLSLPFVTFQQHLGLRTRYSQNVKFIHYRLRNSMVSTVVIAALVIFFLLLLFLLVNPIMRRQRSKGYTPMYYQSEWYGQKHHDDAFLHNDAALQHYHVAVAHNATVKSTTMGGSMC